MCHEVSMYIKQPRFHRISTNWFLLNASHMFHLYHQKRVLPQNQIFKKATTFKTKMWEKSEIDSWNMIMCHPPTRKKKQQVPTRFRFFLSNGSHTVSSTLPEAESASDGRITELLGWWWWMVVCCKTWLVRVGSLVRVWNISGFLCWGIKVQDLQDFFRFYCGWWTKTLHWLMGK